MSIPQADRDRLLASILGVLGPITAPESDKMSTFRHRVETGWEFMPVLDLQDVATIARIASGERWEGRTDG